MCIRFGHCQHRQLRVGSQSSQHSQIVSNALLIRRMRVWAISTLSTFTVVIELARDSVSGWLQSLELETVSRSMGLLRGDDTQSR